MAAVLTLPPQATLPPAPAATRIDGRWVASGLRSRILLPLGIALAFGRRSSLTFVRGLCTLFVEFWRGVPLLGVLFMGLVLLPMVLPDGVTVDVLPPFAGG